MGFLSKYKAFSSVILFITIILIAQTNWFVAVNNYIYDLFIFMNKTNLPQKEIVIVEIDNKSIQKFGRWPWDRKMHAKLLDTLFANKAKVVGLYINFPDPSNENSDNILFSALRKYPVVIIDSRITTSYIAKTPFWKAISKTCSLGHNILPVSKDNTIRKQLLFVNDKPSFALAILELINKEQYNFYKSLQKQNIDNNILLINYKRTPSFFLRYSYSDILDNNFNPDIVKDKIVLVSITLKGLSEFYVTPFSRNEGKYSLGTTNAIFVQAEILDSLMNFKILGSLNNIYLYLLLLPFIFILLNVLKPFGVFMQLMLSFVLLPIIILSSTFVIFELFNLWITPLVFLLASLLSFVAISISVIANTSRFLDKYISELSSGTKNKLILKTEGSVDGKLLSLKGLTDLIQADKNILETVLSSVNSVIMLFDQDGNILYSNNVKYYWENMNIEDISTELILDEIKGETQNDSVYEKNITLKGNHYKFFVSLAKDNLYVGILNDITDIVKMNEMKSNMMRMLSHEFKTPLATILLCSDYMKELNKNESITTYIDKITAQVEFLEELIDNFFTLNKLEIPDFQINKAPVDLNQLLDSVITNLKVIADNKKINIVYKPDEKIPEQVYSDEKYLQIVVKNLIDNAIKYSPPDTTITVSCELLEDKAKISVMDEGFGITEEDLKRLFEKFYRVKTDQTKGIKGTGLGLSFVKRIVDLHDGEIAVKSQLNVGSEFIVYLPLQDS